MAGSDFKGVMDAIIAEAEQPAAPAPAAPAPAPAPSEPVAAAPAAPETPKPTETPRAQEPPKETPPAPAAPTAAQIKKWKLKGKVAGEEKEWEFGEDDLDEAKNPEGYKKLQQVFQKAEDYDRPGGALDQRATKLAQDQVTAWMLKEGWLLKTPDGKLIENPLSAGYREYVAAKAKGQTPAAAPAAPQAQAPAPAAAPQTDRQKRIAQLSEQFYKPKAEGGGLDRAELDELNDLRIEEKLDQRETARERAARERQERETAEATQRQTAEAKRTAEQQANQAYWDNEIAQAVAANANNFRDLTTGQIDLEYVEAAKARMTAVILQSGGDAKAARTAFDQFAASHAAKLKAIADKSIRQPTAPPPAPVTRGSAGGPTAADKEDTFDYSKGFARQPGRLAAWEKQQAGASG